MTFDDIARLRLANQQVGRNNFKTVTELVGWMGAIQAQDLAWAKWAVGVRMAAATEAMVDAALTAGKIFRTHVLRPTWHLVPARDIGWMLELTAPFIKARLKSRHKALGFNPEIISRSQKILKKTLARGRHLTREELDAALQKAGVRTDSQRFHHILLMAELGGVLCNGIKQGNEQTYALLADRAPNQKQLSQEEALAELARRYFTSRGPATVVDFAWWSGLPATKAKTALAMVNGEFKSATVASQVYWFPEAALPKFPQEQIFLLPAFDEFVISYADRSAMLSVAAQAKSISNNGVFWPLVVYHGKVIGLWKRTLKKSTVAVEASYFKRADTRLDGLVKKAVGDYERFCFSSRPLRLRRES